MSPRKVILALFALLALAGFAAGCGEEEAHSEVAEGQPLELGELTYNVAITRFLNPDDVEDAEYLEGMEEPPPGKSYLGVFMLIVNHSDEEAIESADSYTVIDTTETEYEPLDVESAYGLEIGATVPAEGQLPDPDSTAFYGPTQGAMLLFLVDDSVSESRPLKMEIESPDGVGEVELDI